MKRTTILADEDLLIEAKFLASRQGKTLTEVIQEALRDYVRAHQSPRRISFTGLGHSGQPQLWQEEESILATEVTSSGGWDRREPLQSAADAPSHHRRQN